MKKIILTGTIFLSFSQLCCLFAQNQVIKNIRNVTINIGK